MQEVAEIETNVVRLWDEKNGFVKNGTNYGGEETDEALSEGYGAILGDET
jgi:hypothetical protein